MARKAEVTPEQRGAQKERRAIARSQKVWRGEYFSASVYVNCQCPKCQTPEGAEDANHWPTVDGEFTNKIAAILWAGKEMKRNPLAVGSAIVRRCFPDDEDLSRWPDVWCEEQAWSV